MGLQFSELNINNQIKRLFPSLLTITLALQMLIVVPMASATHLGENGDIIAAGGSNNDTIIAYDPVTLEKSIIYSTGKENDTVAGVAVDGSGTKIAYLSLNSEGYQIYMYDRTTNTSRLLKTYAGTSSSESPFDFMSLSSNGEYLAISLQTRDGGGAGSYDVLIIQTSSGEVITTHERAVVTTGGWNTNDNEVLAIDGQDNSIVWLNRSSSEKTVVIPGSSLPSDIFAIQSAAISPDKQKIAYSLFYIDPSFPLSLRAELVEVNVDGTNTRQIATATSTGIPIIPEYSPDGQDILYAITGTTIPTTEYVMIDSQTLERKTATSDVQSVVYDWSPIPTAPADTTAPVISITNTPPALSNNPSQSVSFTVDDPMATVTCQVDSQPETTCSSPFTTAQLADGQHTVTIRATDPNNNTGTATTSPFTIDTAAPDTTITTGPTGNVYTDSHQFTFSSSEQNSTFVCRLQATAAWTACTSPFSTGQLQPGQYNFQVRAKDAAGNTDQSPASRAFTFQRCTVGPITLPLIGTVCL